MKTGDKVRVIAAPQWGNRKIVYCPPMGWEGNIILLEPPANNMAILDNWYLGTHPSTGVLANTPLSFSLTKIRFQKIES